MSIKIPRRKHKVAEAFRLHKAGVSAKQIAKRMSRGGVKISDGTIRNFIREAQDAADAAASADPTDDGDAFAGVPQPPPEPPAVGAADGNALEQARAMLLDARRLAEQAKADGNHSAAQRALRDATALATLVAREEKRLGGDAEVYPLSRAELERAYAEVVDRFKALGALPITCAECGAKLRMRAVTGEETRK